MQLILNLDYPNKYIGKRERLEKYNIENNNVE